MYRKEIVYSGETRDYALYLDGELVGFARSYHEAEVALDQLVYELMSMYHREIVFDRGTHDYAMYLDGELVGFARSYHEAEATLEQLVYELMSGEGISERRCGSE